MTCMCGSAEVGDLLAENAHLRSELRVARLRVERLMQADRGGTAVPRPRDEPSIQAMRRQRLADAIASGDLDA